MSDDEVVASDVPRGTCYLQCYLLHIVYCANEKSSVDNVGQRGALGYRADIGDTSRHVLALPFHIRVPILIRAFFVFLPLCPLYVNLYSFHVFVSFCPFVLSVLLFFFFFFFVTLLVTLSVTLSPSLSLSLSFFLSLSLSLSFSLSFFLPRPPFFPAVFRRVYGPLYLLQFSDDDRVRAADHLSAREVRQDLQKTLQSRLL